MSTPQKTGVPTRHSNKTRAMAKEKKILPLGKTKKKRTSTTQMTHAGDLTKRLEIAFWARRFAEHCKFMVDGAQDGLPNVPRSRLMQNARMLARLQRQWTSIANRLDPQHARPGGSFLSPVRFDGQRGLRFQTEQLEALAHHMAQLQEKMKHLFSRSPAPNADCYEALMEHMQDEEVEYFVPAILHEALSPLDELAFWATEHATNTEFVNCQLEAKLEGRTTPPLRTMLAQNQRLIHEFQAIKQAAQQQHHLQHAGALFQRMMQAKKKHTASVHKLMEAAPTLPLPAKFKTVLLQNLQHEAREAEFARQRLQFVFQRQQTQ